MSERHMSAPVATSRKDHNQFGNLPEWDLSDLYPGRESPELKRDLEWARSEAKAFEGDYKGKLDSLTREGRLIDAIKRVEKLNDTTGRLGSFAYLHYAQNTSDGARAKFLGDLSQALTDLSTGLIFFELELNRIDDDALEAAFAADQALARYRPWFVELRKSKPYQLEDRVEELFHEKSVTGAQAWNRLFDETMAGLRFPYEGRELSSQEIFDLLSNHDRE
ncbi:MAG: hypothetical protein KC766_39845, partial [Myxococcales bacterium]|nr:hypothetical protein [Myxococcales bacterium]